MTKPRYPDIDVQLTGQDAFAVLGAVIKAMKEHGVPTAQRKAFYEQATRGDYDHLLRVCMYWVTCDEPT
jgi:hypothetical protein